METTGTADLNEFDKIYIPVETPKVAPKVFAFSLPEDFIKLSILARLYPIAPPNKLAEAYPFLNRLSSCISARLKSLEWTKASFVFVFPNLISSEIGLNASS